jgi:hypothetical protein
MDYGYVCESNENKHFRKRKKLFKAFFAKDTGNLAKHGQVDRVDLNSLPSGDINRDSLFFLFVKIFVDDRFL